MSTRTGTPRIALAILGAGVLALSTGALPTRPSGATAAPLTAGSDFTITSTVSASADTADQPALLYPSAVRYLWYTVHNPTSTPITVTSLGVDRVDAPAECSAANLDLGDPTFTGSFVVPADSALTVPAPMPITLVDLPAVNQDACKNVTFTFTFSGTAYYSEITEPTSGISTITRLEVDPNPAVVNSPVTLTARVLTSSREVPAVGTVTFSLTTIQGSARVLGTLGVDADGIARLHLDSLPVGTDRLSARFDGGDLLAESVSAVTVLDVVAPPAACPGSYPTAIIAEPGAGLVRGTSGDDFIYAADGDVAIKAGRGNDCVVVGDGNNIISDGSGADVVIAGDGTNRITVVGSGNTLMLGNGSGNRVLVRGAKKKTRTTTPRRNQIAVGDGSGNRVVVRRGTRNQVTIGQGSANRVIARGSTNRITLGNGADNHITAGPGHHNQVTIGNGDHNRIVTRGRANRVTVGEGATNRVITRGSKNRITLGNGADNRITAGRGHHNQVTVGNGAHNRVLLLGTANRARLGMGQGNTVVAHSRVAATRARCSVPAPPPTWWLPPERYYGDSVRNARVVTR